MSRQPQATITASRTRAGWNVKIILGGIGVLAVVILAFTFRLELGLLALAIGGAYTVGKWFVLSDARERGKLERRKLEADVWIVEQRANQEELVTQQMALAARIHETKIGVFWFPDFDAPQPVYYPATAGERRQVAGLLPSPQSEPERISPLMPLIERETCLCFFGPRGSGKTSIALNWLSGQPGTGIIFDPKGRELNLWPEQFEVVSDVNRMIPAAERFMARLERYRQARRIKPEPMLFFVDELKYLANQHGVNLLPYIMNIAMFGREYNFHSGFTTQATTVKHLDIDAADLLDNFVVVRSAVEAGQYHCFVVGLDGREIEYQPPPPYPKPRIPIEDLDAPQLAPGPEFETEEEAAIYRILTSDPDATDYRICKDVWGKQGSSYVAKINAVKERYGPF